MIKLCWIVLVGFASMTGAQSDSMTDITRKAETGDAQAQFELGLAYDEGRNKAQDFGLAAEWYKKSAEQGNASAQNNLGVLNRNGFGMPQNKEEAARWFTKAAQQCNPDAAYNIGIAYYNGDGVVTDPGLAFPWLVVAKQCGNSNVEEAINRISAEMRIRQRQTGESKFVNYVLATPEFKPDVDQLFKQLTTYNPPLAMDLCEAYAKDGKPWFNDAKAATWCQQALSQQDFGAYEVLGRLAERRGDFATAFKFYLDGVNHSPYLKLDRLGILLLEGKGVAQDAAEAYFWLYIAVKSDGYRYLQPKLDLASQQISGKERKKQEKRAAEWVQQRLKRIAQAHQTP